MSKKLRIGFVTTHPPGTGSLNEYAYHFLRYLRLKPEVAEIILLADQLPEGESYQFDDQGAPIQIYPCWRFGDWLNGWRIMQAVRETKPDIVLFNIQFASFGSGKIPATLGLLAPLLVKTTGSRSVVLLHNIMETVDLQSAGFAGNPIMEGIIRFVGTVVTRLVLVSDLVTLTIPKYVEILEAKYKTTNIVLAPHGSFEHRVAPSGDLPDGPIQIMSFGKFGTYKKVEILLEAFKLLQDGSRPPLELVIAGSNSPNAANYLEDVAVQYADVPNVRYTGYVAEEDVPIIFGEAAVVVFPYTSTTGSSGVLHQAGDYAKAAVLPRIGDFAEVISEEGYTGEFFDPNSAVDLADAIARVIDHPKHRHELGMRNYLAATGLPMNDIVDWYLLHFEALLEGK